MHLLVNYYKLVITMHGMNNVKLGMMCTVA